MTNTQAKDQASDDKAKAAELAKSQPHAKELTDKELDAVSGGFGVTNTGTGGSNLGSGGGRS
jgi:bacteriocin-like protein